jgi:uncharacterized damage-inducible protein DinB
MKRVALVLLLTLLIVTPSVADDHEGGSKYGATLAANFEFVSGQLLQLAEAMPEGVYSWRPAEGVRSTSEAFMHIVGANMLLPPAIGVAAAPGLTLPENPFSLARQWEAEVTAKADVKAKLEESIAYVKQVFATFPEAALDEEVALFGTTMPKRAALLVLLSHSHEHLGQLIAYARSNGVTPPWSQPMPEGPPEG